MSLQPPEPPSAATEVSVVAGTAGLSLIPFTGGGSFTTWRAVA